MNKKNTDNPSNRPLATVAQDLAARKKTGALLLSVEEYRFLVDNSYDAILVTAPDGAIYYANPAACSMFGYREEELYAGGRQCVFDSSDPDILAVIAQNAHTGRFQCVLTLHRKNGSKFQAEVSTGIFSDNRGGAKTSMVIRDITHRLRAEEAMRKSETQFKDIQQISHSGSWEYDPETRTTNWSDEMFILFQVRREDFIKDASIVRDRIHPADFHAYVETVYAMFKQGLPLRTPLEFRVILPSGETRHLSLMTVVPAEEDAASGRIRGVVQDITESKRSRRIAFDTLRYNRAIIEFASIGIATCTAGGRVISANPAMERITGGTQRELLDQNVFQLGSWKNSGMLAAAEEALAGGQEIKIETRTVSSFGKEMMVECSFIPFDYEGSRRLLVLLADIFERKKAEEELRRSHEELRLLTNYVNTVREEERKNLSREFHDSLGQTITALKMKLYLLTRLNLDKNQRLSRPAVARELEATCEMADKMIRSIQEIIAGLRPAVLDHLGLVAAIQAEADDFSSRSKIACRCFFPTGEIHPDDAASIALFRICQEALTNIVRYAGASEVKIKLSQSEAALILEISDNGRGINQAQEIKEISFGLIGMRERALGLGGMFEIGGEPNRGTVIRVRVPIKDRPQAERGT